MNYRFVSLWRTNCLGKWLRAAASQRQGREKTLSPPFRFLPAADAAMKLDPSRQKDPLPRDAGCGCCRTRLKRPRGRDLQLVFVCCSSKEKILFWCPISGWFFDFKKRIRAPFSSLQALQRRAYLLNWIIDFTLKFLISTLYFIIVKLMLFKILRNFSSSGRHS